MATTTPKITTSEVEVQVGKVNSKTTISPTTDTPHVETSQTSSTPVVKVYCDPSEVFNELPVTTLAMITDLTKKKFSDEIVATGQITDSKMSEFRGAWLRDVVSAAHKQFLKVTTEKNEKKAREFYKELRARGMEREECIKLSGYNPDLV